MPAVASTPSAPITLGTVDSQYEIVRHVSPAGGVSNLATAADGLDNPSAVAFATLHLAPRAVRHQRGYLARTRVFTREAGAGRDWVTAPSRGRRPRVLPCDRVRDRLPAPPVLEDDRLRLVRDPDCSDIRRGDAGRLQRITGASLCAAPDLGHVELDPARLGGRTSTARAGRWQRAGRRARTGCSACWSCR